MRGRSREKENHGQGSGSQMVGALQRDGTAKAGGSRHCSPSPCRGHQQRAAGFRPNTAPPAAGRRVLHRDDEPVESRVLWPETEAGRALDEDTDEGEDESNIRVFVRTRPASSLARGGASVEVCSVVDTKEAIVTLLPEEGATLVAGGTCNKEDTFRFGEGMVLDPDLTQDQVFDKIGRPAASSVLDGFNVTVFAYGQTGSGKTHTMYGDETALEEGGDTGLAGRILEHLFEVSKGDATAEYRFEVSVLGVYDERVIDLFEPEREKRVREGPEGVVVEGATWKGVESEGQIRRLLRAALANRKVGETRMNARSSRSHTICCVKVHREEACGPAAGGAQSAGSPPGGAPPGGVLSRTAYFNLVDLCGSERVKKSEVSGERLREAININTSLSALKSVVQALGDRQSHVPYRSSKLTWLLKDGLGGNSRVFLVAHVNPSAEHRSEGLSTLRFVSFARTVTVRARRNARVKTVRERVAELEGAGSSGRGGVDAETQTEGACGGAAAGTQTEGGGGGLEEEMRGIERRWGGGEISALQYRDEKARVLSRYLGDICGGEGGVRLFIEGPGEEEEEELCVRMGAKVSTVLGALRAAKGLEAGAGLELWVEGGRLRGGEVVRDLGLEDGDVLQARWGARDWAPGCL